MINVQPPSGTHCLPLVSHLPRSGEVVARKKFGQGRGRNLPTLQLLQETRERGLRLGDLHFLPTPRCRLRRRRSCASPSSSRGRARSKCAPL